MEQRRRPALQRHQEIDTQFRRTRSGAARLISPFGRAQCTRRSLHVLTPEALMNPKAAEGLRYAFRELSFVASSSCHWFSSANQILRMIMYFFIILGLDQADGQRICHKNSLANRFKI